MKPWLLLGVGLLTLACEDDTRPGADRDAAGIRCAVWNPPPCTCGDGAPGRAVCGPDSGIAGCKCDGGPFDAYIRDAAIPDVAPPARRFDAAPRRVVDAAPPECDEGETLTEPCPVGGDDIVLTCREGRWSGCHRCGLRCIGTPNETRPCPDGSGMSSRTCVGNGWTLWSACGEGTPCADGEVQTDLCGPSLRRRTCVDGRWPAWGPCETPPGCPDGSEPPCRVGGVLCPEGIANAFTEPFAVGDVAVLDAVGLADGDICWPVAYAWSVVGRPTGSLAQPLEGFVDAINPGNGGPPDDENTPTALLFLDEPGTYDVELRVTDANGLTSPSADCPARRAWARIVAEPAP